MLVISLFDLTGIMVKPWAAAGHECICIDLQHPKEPVMKDSITFMRYDLSLDSNWNFLTDCFRDQKLIIFSFPPCTDLAGSGAAWWQQKGAADPDFQFKAADLPIKTERMANKLKAPYMIENPRGVLSSLWRKPDFEFNPCDYGGYLPPDDVHPLYPDHIPARDAYTKLTCIWCGNGFKIPKKIRVEPEFLAYRKGDGSLMKVSRPAAKLGGDSLKTKNIRSATPRGFAQAVFVANL